MTYTLLFNQTVMAQSLDDYQLPNYKIDSRDMKFAMEFSNIMMRVSEEVYDNEEDFIRALNNPTEETLEPLKKGFLLYAESYEKFLNLNPEKRIKFQSFWKRLDFKKVAKLISESLVGMKLFFKKRGFSVALAVAMGVLSEWLVPIFLVNIGLSALVPLSMMTPWSTMYLGVPNAINKTILKRKITKELGGKTQYQAYRAQLQATHDTLKLTNPDQLILPLSQEGKVVDALVIPKQSTWNSLLTKIGLHPKRLNYQSIRIFLKEKGIDDNYIKWVIDSPEFDKSIKIYLITNHILKYDDEELVSSFKTRYSSHFITVQNSANWSSVENWSRNMIKATSLEDVNFLTKNPPDGISTKEMLQLWQKLFLPEYAGKFPIDYRAYRKMDDQLEILRARSINENNPLWNKEWGEEFLEKVLSPMNKTLNTCKSKEANLLRYLILN